MEERLRRRWRRERVITGMGEGGRKRRNKGHSGRGRRDKRRVRRKGEAGKKSCCLCDGKRWMNVGGRGG